MLLNDVLIVVIAYRFMSLNLQFRFVPYYFRVRLSNFATESLLLPGVATKNREAD